MSCGSRSRSRTTASGSRRGRPASNASAVEFVQGVLKLAPALVPVYGRRYMPSRPDEFGNPVFTLDGAVVSYAGFDLVAYYKNEFHLPYVESEVRTPRRIDFWTDLVNLT